MLIDNKTKFHHQIKDLYQFFKENMNKGTFDMVSGYFSIGMLADFFDNFKEISQFRMILGILIEVEKKGNAQIDLLSQKPTLREVLQLKSDSEKAINFLRKKNVAIKTFQDKFCHAKAYIYKNEGKGNDSFFSVGSSNFTRAGLTDQSKSNIELNYARTGQDPDFDAIKKWYHEIWNDKNCREQITIDKKDIDYREYIIGLISKLYKEYTPDQIYHKILFELFSTELLEYEPEMEKKLEHLKESIIWERLFDFQKQGVLSLLRMLQQHNGAILADAVGLGKTWQALAVIKFFELEGYKTVLICPKKLANNWERYQSGNASIFDADDFRYTIRFHTDLQGDSEKGNRMQKDDFKTLQKFFQNNAKILFVIDESHNLRNDKSERYKFLVENLLQKNKNVKMLLLSATPINTAITDIRNQFKLLAKGEDTGFSEKFQIKSLEVLFGQLQKEFNIWQKKGEQEVRTLLEKVPQNFFRLTDSLVVARTRQMIEKSISEKEMPEQEKLRESLKFPKKQAPINRFHSPKDFGDLDSSQKIIDALVLIEFSAYQPAKYIKSEAEWKKDGVTKDEAQRQSFLAKMMFFLLIKRLESSWHSFYETLKNILEHHKQTKNLVSEFMEKRHQKEQTLDVFDQKTEKELEEIGADLSQYTLGKKQIPLSDLKAIGDFHKSIELDIKKMSEIAKNVEKFVQNLKKKEQKDEKLEDLILQIQNKRKNNANKKVLIFTVFKDTAFYLYDSLCKIFLKEGIAVVSGDESKNSFGFVGKKFEPILEQFAPYTKLFKEGNWIDDFLEEKFPKKHFSSQESESERKKVSFQDWKNFIQKSNKQIAQKLEQPIEILIATDCLSEGQNLQDCDCVINYDIHWNPVRLIQRFGRIDRIGSKNESILGINFWIGKNYEDTLNLKNRVEKRMAAMSLAGTEIMNTLTPEMEKMMQDNPLISQQEQKMLEQMQITWEDVEVSTKNLSLADFSMEIFRQDLRDYLLQRQKELKEMPDGVFSGFKLEELNKKIDAKGKNIMALIRSKIDQYLYLIFINQDGKIVFENNFHNLLFLRQNKNEKRKVDAKIETGEAEILEKYSDMLKNGIIRKGIEEEEEDFDKAARQGFGAVKHLGKKQNATQDYFQPKNFHLIVWETVENL